MSHLCALTCPPEELRERRSPIRCVQRYATEPFLREKARLPVKEDGLRCDAQVIRDQMRMLLRISARRFCAKSR